LTLEKDDSLFVNLAVWARIRPETFKVGLEPDL